MSSVCPVLVKVINTFAYNSFDLLSRSLRTTRVQQSFFVDNDFTAAILFGTLRVQSEIYFELLIGYKNRYSWCQHANPMYWRLYP